MKSVFALGRIRVRRSGYGAMQMAGQFAAATPPDRESAIGVLRAAVQAGVDHIDTAQYYGPGTVNGLIRDPLGCAARCGYHERLTSVSRNRPRSVISNRRMLVSGGEYAWMLTAVSVESFLTSWTCSGPNDRSAPDRSFLPDV